MKIAFLTDGMTPFVVGGMQNFAFFLTKYLAREEVYVDLYHCKRNNAELDTLGLYESEEQPFIKEFIIKIPVVASYPGHYLKESYLYSENIYKVLSKNLDDVDLIYSHGFSGWFISNLPNKENLPPTAVNFHGLNMFQPAPNFKAYLQHLMLRNPVRKIIKNTDFVFSYGGKINTLHQNALGVSEDRLLHFSNGIQLKKVSQTAPNSSSKRKFVFIGRYERLKGIEELLLVLKTLEKEFDFEFNFVGKLPEKVHIKSEKIHFLGFVSDEDLDLLLSTSDILVCPSISEGMPTVILEAMAKGLAIIATDVGAINEQIKHDNGWLIKPKNPDELYEALVSAIEISAEELNSKKETSLKHVKETFTWERLIKNKVDQLKLMLK